MHYLQATNVARWTGNVVTGMQQLTLTMNHTHAQLLRMAVVVVNVQVLLQTH